MQIAIFLKIFLEYKKAAVSTISFIFILTHAKALFFEKAVVGKQSVRENGMKTKLQY